MPIIVACQACQNKMRVGDQLAGKAVKCSKCAQAVRVPAPAPVAAGAPAEAPAPPSAPNLAVTCGGCQKKMSVRAALAGKAVKCPGCGQPVKVPAPAAADDGEWMEVNEAAAPPPRPVPVAVAGAAPAKGGGPDGDWGKALLDAKEVPDEMQDELKSEMTKNERVVWAERPRQDILMYQAKKYAIIGGSITGLISLIALVVTVICAIKGSVVGILVGLVFVLLPGVFCYILVTGPARTARNEARRACFVLTNRRLLIHKGAGLRMTYHKTREDAMDDDGRRHDTVGAWTGFELTPMRRWEHKKFEGAGSLCFTRGLYEDSPAEDVWSIDDVRGVEKMLREKLLHPIIDKLLRGEQLSQAERGTAEDEKGAGEGDLMKADTNIKDYGRTQRRGGNDPNVKAAPGRAGGLNFDLARVPKDARQRVEEELTSGERIVWIGRPEAAAKGRGFFGAVMGSAYREEPKYDLYAITNRRAILFFENDKEVPISYYTPQVARAGLEDDKRVENGGNIVFKKVRKIVETVEKGTTKVLKREETHYYYGLLRIRNYKAVADLLYDTLVGPARW